MEKAWLRRWFIPSIDGNEGQDYMQASFPYRAYESFMGIMIGRHGSSTVWDSFFVKEIVLVTYNYYHGQKAVKLSDLKPEYCMYYYVDRLQRKS